MSDHIQTEQNVPHQPNGNDQLNTRASSSALPGAFLAIANAYGDYTKKSLEHTRLFVEKLSGVKSLDKAIEVQADFAKATYGTFVVESQKIGTLYGDLAKESYKPFAEVVAKMTPTNR
ncbi:MULTISPECIES: phasin family protein [unclassified Bradyrhizobium]|uniref:phasin family protein n=1 Tax=unclassified Bradyrhizobium TaxID=2631580 RepID=UPI002302C71F|nr:phasin family protein [Bradyrhizobium sp. CCBAU 45321]MDA9546596.1 phasin family protein [Bradyrhizobium sp. CCBAU 45321]